jgi:dTDP-glucose 4,6-dehydratase
MRHILVTGGAGFIGSNFVHYLLQADPQVHLINLDALTYAGSLENLKTLTGEERHEFVQGDICDRDLVESLLKKHRVDTIVNFAAETHVDRSINDSKPFIHTNIVGTHTLLEGARKFWLEEKTLPLGEVRFHHISTDEVYGSLRPADPPFSEATPYSPNSPYAASKASSDHLVRSFAHTYGLPATISNCSNNFGPYQYPEKLIPLMILNARSGKPLPVYGDGKQVRDWLYVVDHCEAIHSILVSGKPGETYNLGGGTQPTNLAVVETICDLIDELQPSTGGSHRKLIQYVTDRPGHDRRYAMNIAKVKRELGWEPRHSLSESLRETVEWYLSHPEWVITINEQATYQQWLEKNYAKRVTQL